MTVRVNVKPNTVSRPVNLVLTSKEATRWIIHLPRDQNVTISDIVIVSKYVGHSSVLVVGSRTPVRDWAVYEANFGYLEGWNEERTLLFTVEEWFGLVTSFTGTDTASEARLTVGLPRDSEANKVTCRRDPFSPDPTRCNDLLFMYPFKRGLHSSERLYQSYSCYTGAVGAGHEVHGLSVYSPTGPIAGGGWWGTETLTVYIEKFAGETLHPIHLLVFSYNQVDCTVRISPGITVTDITLASKYASGSSIAVQTITGDDLDIPVGKITAEYDYSGTEESLVDYAEEIYGFITSYTGVREAERLVLRVGVSNSIVPSNVIRAVTEGPEAEGEAEAEVEVEAEVEEEPEAESETESEPEGEHISTILLGNIGETTLPPKDDTIFKHYNGSVQEENTIEAEIDEDASSKDKPSKSKKPVLGASQNLAINFSASFTLIGVLFCWQLIRSWISAF